MRFRSGLTKISTRFSKITDHSESAVQSAYLMINMGIGQLISLHEFDRYNIIIMYWNDLGGFFRVMWRASIDVYLQGIKRDHFYGLFTI